MRRGRLELRHPRRLGPVLWDREGGLALARGAPQELGAGPRRAGAAGRAAARPEGRPAAAGRGRARRRPARPSATGRSRSRRGAGRCSNASRARPGPAGPLGGVARARCARLMGLAAAGRLGDGACVRADLLAPEVAAALRGGRALPRRPGRWRTRPRPRGWRAGRDGADRRRPRPASRGSPRPPSAQGAGRPDRVEAHQHQRDGRRRAARRRAPSPGCRG